MKNSTIGAAEPIPGATLEFFTALRAVLHDENQPPRNRLQDLDNRISTLSAAPQPERESTAISLLEGERKTPEQVIQEQAEQLVQIAAAVGLEVSIERRALEPLAMRNFESVVSVWPVWTGK